MDRNSMWRMPHRLSTSICFWGSGDISPAKAERVNMENSRRLRVAVQYDPLLLRNNFELHLVGDEGLLALGGEADLDLAQRPETAQVGDPTDAVGVVLND